MTPREAIEVLADGCRNKLDPVWKEVDEAEQVLRHHVDQPLEVRSFGVALEALKAGRRVTRPGWNGKGMWLALTEGVRLGAESALRGAAAHRRAELVAYSGQTVVDVLPHIDMRAADGSLVIGWLASQTDMLAEDWIVLPEST